MLCDRWASTACSDKPKEGSTQAVALSGSLLSIQRSSWLYALGLPSAGLVVLEGRGVHLGACGLVLGSGSEWDPREDELRCKGDRVRGEGG